MMKSERQVLATVYDVHESEEGSCDRCGRKSKIGVELELTGSRYEYCCESCVIRQLVATKSWQARQPQLPPASGKVS